MRTKAWDIPQIFDVRLCSLFHAIALLFNETSHGKKRQVQMFYIFVHMFGEAYAHTHTDICYLLASC